MSGNFLDPLSSQGVIQRYLVWKFFDNFFLDLKVRGKGEIPTTDIRFMSYDSLPIELSFGVIESRI